MRRKILAWIFLSAAVNLILIAVLGFKPHGEGCDVSARGLAVWSDNRGQLGLPRGEWVTLDTAPESADLPPCRMGSKKKTDHGEFRPV